MTFYDRFLKRLPKDPNFPGVYEVDFMSFPDIEAESAVFDIVPGAVPSAGLFREKRAELFRSTGHDDWRPTVLAPQSVVRLYDAMSFLNWRYGLYLNCHIVISARKLGFKNHREFVALLPHFHKEIERTFFEGRSSTKPSHIRIAGKKRIGKRSIGRAPHGHFWIQVIEYARSEGLHVHVLCSAPKNIAAGICEKTEDWWETKSPGWPRPGGIFCRTKGDNQIGIQVNEQLVKVQERHFRYIIKSMAPNGVARDYGDRVCLGTDIFKPHRNDASPVIVGIPQLSGTAQRIGEQARKRAGFSSKFQTGHFDEIYSGWEQEAYIESVRQEAADQLLESLQL